MRLLLDEMLFPVIARELQASQLQADSTAGH